MKNFDANMIGGCLAADRNQNQQVDAAFTKDVLSTAMPTLKYFSTELIDMWESSHLRFNLPHGHPSDLLLKLINSTTRPIFIIGPVPGTKGHHQKS